MATSSISADIKAANSKLAQYLRKQEEELGLQVGKRKPKKQIEERLPAGQGRWRLQPDYRAPSPMVDRPRTVDGATSFHFSFTTISKEAVPTIKGKPVDGVFGKTKSAAVDHSKYIERDGAAEISRGAEHAAYVERPGAVETADLNAILTNAMERSLSSLDEAPTTAEAELLGPLEAARPGIPSVFSNISSDPFERQEFWRAAERIEPNPRVHNLFVRPDAPQAWWNALAKASHVDPAFTNYALSTAEAHRQHMAAPVPEGEEREPFVVPPFKVSAETAGLIIQQTRNMPGFDDRAPPFRFESGRGGRVQIRLVAELPCELSPEDRALLVQNFCDHLATLEERRNLDGTTYRTGLMYTAVIHAPDPHNDNRNYHLHLIAYDRPAKFLESHGMWDFEVAETFTIKRMERVRYPLRQSKIGEVSQGTNKTGKADSGVDFIPGLRRTFSQMTNAVLAARGIQRRLDPRRYTEMGIDRTPTQHLGTKAAALESIGVPTKVGQLNALAIWSDAERSVQRQAVETMKSHRESQAELNGLAAAATRADPTARELQLLRQLTVERDRLIADVADDRMQIMTFDLMEARAKSRALRTRQTCLQFLADIENGVADHSTRNMAWAIKDRFRSAQAHLDSIDADLAPHRPALDKAARDIEARERRILEIDRLVKPLRAVLEPRVIAAGVGSKAPAPDASQQASKGPKAASNAAREQSPKKDQGPATSAEKRGKKARPADIEVDLGIPAELTPASIEGLPIAQPTIGPRQDVERPGLEAAAGVPEGLTPLRPEAAPESPKDGPEVAIDIDGRSRSVTASEPGQNGPSDQAFSPGREASRDAPPEVHTDAGADSEKVDKRRKVTDPSLFPLPEQTAPVKPGTTKAAYVDFDQLMKRISDERIPVLAVRDKASGLLSFQVPSLSADEQAVLSSARFAARATKRLEAIHELQDQEKQRLVRWVRSRGQEPNMLVIQSGVARLGPDVTRAVRTLFDNWGRSEEAKAALRAEFERRTLVAEQQREQAAKAAADEAKAVAKPALSRSEQERELERTSAAKLYPSPDRVQTPEVAEFTRLLREVAPAAELQAAAARVHASPLAREEVHRHSVDLAIAYRQHQPKQGQQQIDRDRSWDRERKPGSF